MKKFKSKIAICLMSVVAMVFVLTSYVGREVQAADLLVDKKEATLNSPVTEVEYVEQSDGKYNINITFDTSIYTKTNLPEWDYVDVANYMVFIRNAAGSVSEYLAYGQCGGIDLNDEDSTVTIPKACRNRNLNPGEEYYIYVDFGCSIDNYGDYATTLKDNNGNIIGFSSTKFIAPCKTHTWDSGKVTKEATCTATGVKTYTCTVCKSTKTETIAKKAHSYSEATCTSPKKCTVCGATTGSALAHTWDSGKVTKEATCTATGIKTYTCTGCKTTKTETIAKKPHNYSMGRCIGCGASSYPTFDITEDFTVAKNSSGTIYTKEFTAEKYQRVSAKVLSSTPSGYTTVELYDSNGTQVASTSNSHKQFTLNNDGYEILEKGTYTLKVTWGTTFAGTAKVNLKLITPEPTVYKFDTVTPVLEKQGNNWYTIKFRLNANDIKHASGTEDTFLKAKDIVIYRENVNTKKIKRVDVLSNTAPGELYSESPYLDHQYKYYAILEYIPDRYFESGELPTGTKVITLTDNAREKLEKYGAVSEVIKVPKPVVGTVSLSQSGGQVKKKTVSMKPSPAKYVSYYKVQRYDKAGTKVISSWTIKKNSDNKQSKTMYIPYEGSYKVKVTPYYTYKPYSGFEKTYTGTSKTITVKSPKLQSATALCVTKISSKKVVITMNPHYNGAKGYVIYQKKSGSSTWKKLVTTTKKKYTVTGTGAGSAQYRFQSYVHDDGKKFDCSTSAKKYYSDYSKAVKTEKNQASLGVSTNPNKYKLFRKYVYPTKLWYDGSKLKMKVVFINTHGYSTKCNASVVVKINGTAICSKTSVSATVGGNGYKEVTVTLKNGKTGYDLLGAQETNTLTWYPKMN